MLPELLLQVVYLFLPLLLARCPASSVLLDEEGNMVATSIAEGTTGALRPTKLNIQYCDPELDETGRFVRSKLL